MSVKVVAEGPIAWCSSNRSLDDPPPGLGLALRALLLGVGTAHRN
jgi:hypothetical protein